MKKLVFIISIILIIKCPGLSGYFTKRKLLVLYRFYRFFHCREPRNDFFGSVLAQCFHF